MDSIKKRKMWECIKSIPYLDTLDENVTEQYVIIKVRGTFLENVEHMCTQHVRSTLLVRHIESV